MAVQIKPDQAYAYAELLEILTFTDESLVNKIPKKLMNIFHTYASPTYEKHLNRNIPVEDQDVSKKTAALIALLSLNYWCESEEEKTELKSILAENEKIKEQELREKYNPDNIFKNEEKIIVTNEEKVSLIVQEDLKWYQKIFNKIKSLFSK